MNDSSLGSPLTKPVPLEPPDRALPPETARDFLANGMLALRANTSFTLGNAFQPAESYERAMVLFQQAIDRLDTHVCALPAGLSQALNSGDGVYRP